MKLRVVGWAEYDDAPYIPEGVAGWAARNAIIDDIKKHGYFFSGWAHQEGYNCAPVLNDGKLYCFSQRGWGGIMAEAHDELERMAYARYSFAMEKEQEVRPTIRYSKLNFTPETDLNEKFNLSVDKSVFDAAKTESEIKLDDLPELRYLDKGDTLELICGEEKTEYSVADVDREKDISKERLSELRMAMYDLNNKERMQRAEDEFNNAKIVIIVKLKKS